MELNDMQSLPMRKRELKQVMQIKMFQGERSLPMRERELKLVKEAVICIEPCRSPCGSVS